LAKTIHDGQLINPIFVYRYGNKCRLIAGERRTLASAIAGKKEIIARIASQRPVGTKLRILQWIENNERVDLSLAERVANLEAIVKEYLIENKNKGGNERERVTAKLLSDLTGMSPTQSRRYILILQTTPEIKLAIAEGKIENIKLIELILSVENAESQKILLEAALSNASFDAINKLKNEIESGQKKKKEVRRYKKIDVSLGKVKPNIAKIIFDALVTSTALKENIVKQLNVIRDSVEWNNSKSVEVSFKKMIFLITQEA
jgi:ParB family chromosome partitioning protein